MNAQEWVAVIEYLDDRGRWEFLAVVGRDYAEGELEIPRGVTRLRTLRMPREKFERGQLGN